MNETKNVKHVDIHSCGNIRSYGTSIVYNEAGAKE